MTQPVIPIPNLRRHLLRGLVAGLVYAILLRIADSGSGYTIMKTVSVAFLFVGPVVLGYLTVREHPSPSWPYRILAPLLPTAVSLLCFLVFGREGAICTLMALPVLLPFSSLGGILGGIGLLRPRGGRMVAALLPFAIMPLEQRFPLPQDAHRLETQIEIHAPAAAVWEEIVEVPLITEAEQRPALFTRLGFPRPISATVDRRGVGGIRRARFEGGVLFLETVTHFEPGRHLRFTIAPQTDSIPPETLDPHVTIGGPYFDVLTGTYTIEPRPGGGVTLHLASEMRVSTHFNFYSRPWVDAIMRSIQLNILEVIRERAEKRALAGEATAGRSGSAVLPLRSVGPKPSPPASAAPA
jgi:hypothetical protein